MTTETTVEGEVGGDKEIGGRGGEGGGGQHLEKRGIGNIGGLDNIRGLVPLCELCQKT